MNHSTVLRSPVHTSKYLDSQYPTPRSEFATPIHSRNTSMSKAFAAQFHLEPHRSIMGINNLITPPNSGEIKTSRSFSVDRSDTQSESGEAFFHTQTSPRAPVVHNARLFTESSAESIEKAQEKEHFKRLAAERSYSAQPDWRGLKNLGFRRPYGVETWKDLCQYEADRGNHLTRPSQQEYEQTLHFLAEMVSRPSVDAAPKITRKRKILQDGSAKRRRTSTPQTARKTSTTPATEDKASSSARRRQVKMNGKAIGAETRSARAPSTKEPKDPNWHNYPDYAPSFDTAPANAMDIAGNTRQFDNKDTKKGPRDLSNDPERNELHPAEQLVASWLHLDCHRFNTSKRQIFQGYVRLLRKRYNAEKRIEQGLEQRGDTKIPNWNKTEAQKLLGIDVSKGSWIWNFYKELGWFEPEAEHFYADFLEESDTTMTI